MWGGAEEKKKRLIRREEKIYKRIGERGGGENEFEATEKMTKEGRCRMKTGIEPSFSS